MSSAASTEGTPAASSPDPVSDGGTSKGLTQGEIIFATVLSFVVLLAVVVGTYVVWRQRKMKAIQQKEADERQRTDMTIDCETGENDHLHGGDTENLQHQDGDGNSRRGSRRATMDSNGSDGNSTGNRRRATVDGMDSRASSERQRSRRATLGSMGSDVSSQYKQAAIDHMNQITQTGRHG